MKPKCYKAGGPHYGRPNWDEFCWVDPFVCSGCGMDFSVLHGGESLHDKMSGRRYGNIVMVAYHCGCERLRFNLLLLDDNDCITSHHTVGEDDLRTHWPEIAEFYVGDDDWGWDDDEYNPIADEREYWPEMIRKYHSALAAV